MLHLSTALSTVLHSEQRAITVSHRLSPPVLAERLYQVPIQASGWIPTIWSGFFPNVDHRSDISQLAHCRLKTGHFCDPKHLLLKNFFWPYFFF